jgi:hypothetical protein
MNKNPQPFFKETCRLVKNGQPINDLMEGSGRIRVRQAFNSPLPRLADIVQFLPDDSRSRLRFNPKKGRFIARYQIKVIGAVPAAHLGTKIGRPQLFPGILMKGFQHGKARFAVRQRFLLYQTLIHQRFKTIEYIYRQILAAYRFNRFQRKIAPENGQPGKQHLLAII